MLSPHGPWIIEANPAIIPASSTIANLYLCLFFVKGQKRQRFRVIHLIEFIQSNNFHIYSIFYCQRFTQNVTLKSKILTKSTVV